MPSNDVPINDRARVVDCAWAMSELQLLARTGEMVLCASAERREPLEKQAEAIRDALRAACEAMRERCAREAMCGICGSPNPSEQSDHPHDRHALQVAYAIRSLKL